MVTGREQPQCPIIRHHHVWPCCLTSCLLSLFATMFPTLPYIMDWVLFHGSGRPRSRRKLDRIKIITRHGRYKPMTNDFQWVWAMDFRLQRAQCVHVCQLAEACFFLDYILTCITHRYTNMTYMKGRAQLNYIEMQDMCASVCADAVAFKECLLFRCIEQFATQVFNTMM